MKPIKYYHIDCLTLLLILASITLGRVSKNVGSLRLNYENALIRLRFRGQGPFTLNSHRESFQANQSNGLGVLDIFEYESARIGLIF